MPFTYSLDALNSLESAISTDRLASYLAAVGGDRHRAIALYERNTLLSEGFYGILQALEVSMRNSIHNVMAMDTGRTDWYDIPSLLQASEQSSVTDAKANIAKSKNPTTPGRVVAQLTFGFWVRLVARKYEKTIWVPHIHKSFPGLSKPNRISVFDRFDYIRDLRNRVAHHERIIHRPLRSDYNRIIEALQWVCPVTASWVNAHNSLQRNYERIK